MWKKAISNTLMFIMIIGFVKIFELIFTPSNTLIGVTLIIAILVLMRENLCKKPIKNLIFLLMINLISGIFSHLSSQSILLGIVVNYHYFRLPA